MPKLLNKLRINTFGGSSAGHLKDPILLQLIMKALHRIETHGGNFYDFPFKGIPKRSPLSPLLAAIALLPLDQAMESGSDVFYARFVDDWIVLTKSKTMLRKIIKKTHHILNNLHLEMHPTKTYIGKVETGFNFLSYYMKPTILIPSREALRRLKKKCLSAQAHPFPKKYKCYHARDTSEYHVNEAPPRDSDMQSLLLSINWWCDQMPDKGKGIQTYLR